MQTHDWIILSAAIAGNVFALIKGYAAFSSRLTRIETNLNWLIKNCPQCPLTLDDLTR